MYRKDYLEDALANEEVFRNILKDIRYADNGRPKQSLLPKNLDVNENIYDLYLRYSSPELSNQFTISYFNIDEKGRAVIAFDNIGDLEKFIGHAGCGVALRYLINPDNSVSFDEEIMNWEFRK